MKDLTIAQAQANVESWLKADKRKGKRQRMPKPNAMQGMVVAEARRLEALKAAEQAGMLDPSVAEQMSRARFTLHTGTEVLLARWEVRHKNARLPHHALLDKWHREATTPQREPAPMRNLAEVNRRVMELKRRVLMIERGAVELAMQVKRLLVAAQGNPTDLGDGRDA